MKRRIYSDKFIDSEIAKIDTIHEKVQTSIDEFPRQLDNDGESVYVCQSLRTELNKYIKRRVDQSYVQGFWYGWSLRDGMKEKE